MKQGLASEASDEIDVEIGDAGGAEALEIAEDGSAIVQAAAGMGFAINEGLHTEADAIDACLSKCSECRIGDLRGGAFDRNFSAGDEVEFCAESSEEALDQVRLK